MRKFITLCFMLAIFITPLRQVQLPPAPVADDGVFIGGQLPNQGAMCADSAVYGSPRAGEVYYYVHKGDVVGLRELSQGVTGWVMIGRAR
jgi:hypothetical protein